MVPAPIHCEIRLFMRLFLALAFALSALAAGSRSSLQTRRLASFSRGGEESSQVATSRILLQAAPKRNAPPAQNPQIPRETNRGKKLYVHLIFSSATHKSLGVFQPKKKMKYRDSRAYKVVSPGKSRLGSQTSERRL
ncbi:hypothetical protein AC1031_007680 [Aphanomyces cochlioides]|nr:hypothetical protein AC1031_007680 [Aphanomyces cochlioides]